MSLLLFMALELSCVTNAEAESPISITLWDGRSYASFENRLHPDNRIGYRFHEHAPTVVGEVPESGMAAGIDPKAVEEMEAEFLGRPDIETFALPVTAEGWIPQQWTFHMAPVADGVDLLWVVETGDTGLNRYYGVQQCFRMSGKRNEEWRRKIAETPAFSEFNLWDAAEKAGASRSSLSYVLRGGAWQPLPAVRETVGARAPLGIAVDTERSGGDLASMTEVGPYNAKMLDPIDTGLVTRADENHEWVCGIYWERTSHVTDHHPADCLHAIVDIGNVSPHSKRALRGKIYWFKGTLDDLTGRWKKDFPAGETGARNATAP